MPEIRIFRRTEGWGPGETHHTSEFTLRSVSLTLKVAELSLIAQKGRGLAVGFEI
jgi:hypothetical protein